MGTCVANKKNIKTSLPLGDRIIKFNIEYEKDVRKYNYSSQTYLKDVKHNLKRQIANTNQENKIIKLYHNGKELIKDDYVLGNFIEGEEINLLMVCFTFTEEMANDKNKIDEALIQKLTSNCEFHKNEKANLICINCSHSICKNCEKDHIDHEIIHKNEIIKFESNLRNNYFTLQNNLKEIGLDLNISDFYKNFRQDLTKQCEDLVDVVEHIKKKQNKIMNDFKFNFDNIIPSLLDHKDKLEELIKNVSESKKETILSNDTEFFDFYFKYKKIINKNQKNEENMEMIKNKLIKYKQLFDEFMKRTDEILNFVNEHYEVIRDFQMTDDNLINIPIYEENFLKESQSVNIPYRNNSPIEMKFGSGTVNQYKSNNNSKINLFNLMSTPKRGTNLAQSFDKLNKITKKFDKKLDSKLFENIQIDNFNSNPNNNFIISGDNNNLIENNKKLENIINIEVSSKNIFIFDNNSKTISRKEVDMSDTIMKRFEAYHSTINYKNKFYISGGYATTSKMFYEYNLEFDKFIKLKEMPNSHSYHNMLGMRNFIFAISGFNSKKVDRYLIDEDVWDSLPDLNLSRSWPGSFSVDNSFIYVFGGVNTNDNKGNKFYEKLDLRGNFSWEIINLNYNEDFPYNFGIVNLINDSFLFLGGKFCKTGENIQNCFSFNKNDGSILEMEYSLLDKDEFDGRLFLNLDEENVKFAQFSSILPNRLYIFDREKNSFEIIQCK